MLVRVSLKLPKLLHRQLEEIVEESERSKSYLIREAIERYLDDHSDSIIASHRSHDKDDGIISSRELRERLTGRD